MTGTTAIGVVAANMWEFTDLVKSYQRMVFNIAYHFLHDRTAAEDIAQDVFLQLHRTMPSFESDSHAKAWLCKVTSHRCIDYARRHRQHLAIDDISEPSFEAKPNDPFMARRLQRLVASLPPKARSVVVLRYQEEMEVEEIAQVLGWSLNTVKSHLQRSLSMLRGKLARALGEVES
jgi:RNA polymerase sigma-70 factor, ECF subfamily